MTSSAHAAGAEMRVEDATIDVALAGTVKTQEVDADAAQAVKLGSAHHVAVDSQSTPNLYKVEQKSAEAVEAVLTQSSPSSSLPSALVLALVTIRKDLRRFPTVVQQ